MIKRKKASLLTNITEIIQEDDDDILRTHKTIRYRDHVLLGAESIEEPEDLEDSGIYIPTFEEHSAIEEFYGLGMNLAIEDYRFG